MGSDIQIISYINYKINISWSPPLDSCPFTGSRPTLASPRRPSPSSNKNTKHMQRLSKEKYRIPTSLPIKSKKPPRRSTFTPTRTLTGPLFPESSKPLRSKEIWSGPSKYLPIMKTLEWLENTPCSSGEDSSPSESSLEAKTSFCTPRVLLEPGCLFSLTCTSSWRVRNLSWCNFAVIQAHSDPILQENRHHVDDQPRYFLQRKCRSKSQELDGNRQIPNRVQNGPQRISRNQKQHPPQRTHLYNFSSWSTNKLPWKTTSTSEPSAFWNRPSTSSKSTKKRSSLQSCQKPWDLSTPPMKTTSNRSKTRCSSSLCRVSLRVRWISPRIPFSPTSLRPSTKPLTSSARSHPKSKTKWSQSTRTRWTRSGQPTPESGTNSSRQNPRLKEVSRTTRSSERSLADGDNDR